MIAEEGTNCSGKVTWPQWLASIEVSLIVTQVGMICGWSSPYFDELTSPDSELSITGTQASWVVSLVNMARLAGAITGAVFVNYTGSKTTVLITNVPIALCWLFKILASNVNWLYAARFAGGVSLGMIYSCFSLFLGEIADPAIRGRVITIGSSGVSTGLFLMSVMGTYLSIKASAMAALFACLLLTVLFSWLPESPHHLIKTRRYEKARSSIRWYRRDCDVEKEFVALQQFVSLDERSLRDVLRELNSARFRRSMLVVSMLFIFSHLSGINSVAFYMEPMLNMARVNVLRPAHVVMLVMSFGIVGSFVSSFLMDRLGRRTLMIASCLGAALSLGLLTVVFQLLRLDVPSSRVEGLAIFGMLSFYVSAFVGLLSSPSAILGELFPSHLKCYAACFASCVSGIFSFASTSTYPLMLALMTERYVFLFYSLCSLVAIPFTLLYVPETKGMTFQEIQRQLTNEK